MDYITVEQAEKMYKALWPSFNYLARLKERLQKVNFPTNDSFHRAVLEAHGAMQGMMVNLHYLTCENGVGVPPRPREEDELS